MHPAGLLPLPPVPVWSLLVPPPVPVIVVAPAPVWPPFRVVDEPPCPACPTVEPLLPQVHAPNDETNPRRTKKRLVMVAASLAGLAIIGRSAYKSFTNPRPLRAVV